MRTAFVMLAHQRLDRAAQLANHLLAAGASVVVHLDRQVPADQQRAFCEALHGPAQVISTRKAEWGRLGIVLATLDALRALRAMDQTPSHVMLISGADLPLRPLGDLDGYLAAHGGEDFIETVPITRRQWVQSGLSSERFTLYHPISHRDHPRLFSLSVELQRRLGIKRAVPSDLTAHLGLQWWCLSVETIDAILEAPRLAAWLAYFRKAWIPDESFFQTVVHTVRPEAVRHMPLLLHRFAPNGRPYVFHDDHDEVLAASDYFFARKIDPDAGGLYRQFLGGGVLSRGTSFARHRDNRRQNRARAQEDSEGRGMASPARLPHGLSDRRAETCAPYVVLIGPDPDAIAALRRSIRPPADVLLHGRLFGPDPADFADPGTVTAGNLSGAPILRDYRPAQFLSRLIWGARDRRVVFLFSPADCAKIAHHLALDRNARLVFLGSAGSALQQLRQPVKPKRRTQRPVKPLTLWCWYRSLEGGDDQARRIEALLRGDWGDPADWTVPPEDEVFET